MEVLSPTLPALIQHVKRFQVRRQPGTYSVCRLPAGTPAPAWATGSFVSITSTSDEVSVICPASCVPEGVRAEPDWALIKVVGPFAFTEVGVISALSGTLASAGFGVVAVGTFDTDYLLVKSDQAGAALASLRDAGHLVDE
jgi:hypothetical protein